MTLKYENPKLKQSQKENQLSYSTSQVLYKGTKMIQICFHRTEFNQVSPINEQKRQQIQIWITIHIMTVTSEDLVKPNRTSNRRNKNVLKAGSMQENIEINDQNLEEILNINDI